MTTSTKAPIQLSSEQELLEQQHALATELGTPVEELLAQLATQYKVAMLRYQAEADRLRAELFGRYGS